MTEQAKVDELVRKISDSLGKDVRIFDEQEAATLAEIARVERAHPGAFEAWASLRARMVAIGWFGTLIKGVLIWFVGAVAAWAAFKSALAPMLRSFIGGGQ